MPRYSFRVFSALAIISLFAGCSSYQLGTGSKLTFKTLHVAPVKMVALVPQAEPIIGTQLRTAFIHDGRLTLKNSTAAADATLSVAVHDYYREVGTVRPGDTGLARKFIITMTAEATLTDNRNGKDFFTARKLTVKRDVYTDSGQQQAEYQILPLLAEDLAAKVSHAVLDTW